jgi:hypothetical protein
MRVSKDDRHVIRYASKYFPPTINNENIDWEHFGEKYDKVQKEMEANGTWFEDGQNYNFRKAESRDIALGRYQYYVWFSDFLYEKYRNRFYLLDFMTRIKNDHAGSGLLYYIASASEIHINLEGIKISELYQATIGIGRLATNQNELKAKFATAWEINQVFHRNLLKNTVFHTGSKLNRICIYIAMGGKVKLKNIKSDNKKASKEALAIAENEIEEL